ncbi:MAG: aminotransferase class I/II-fold pyridoxal phosphate-dependent enzyme [Oscillospiraceae bacterium]|nr:aminotransferase class I/II-fold pyridoxal phosphate-dependent enzyme [Oscillospiraceae bacterium]
MNSFKAAARMEPVHSDIRGPLFVEANAMAARGIPVLKLNTGNPATFGFGLPDSLRAALLENVDKAVGYCDVKGMPAARQAIYDYHVNKKGFTGITPDSIYIGNGVSEVANMVATSLFDVGDEILVPSPSYSLWTNLVYLAEAKPVFYTCDEQSAWYPDLADIRRKITPKTKAIVIINPNNPTGTVYPDEIVLGMVQIARENNLIIMSDEIYDRLTLDGYVQHSTAALAPDMPVITFNGLSKSHIVCGFRCGWMVISGPESFTVPASEAIQKLAAMRLCGNALTQLVIPAALGDPESTQAMLVPGGRLYEQREATCRALDQIPGITYVKNHAAFYLFPKIDTKRFNITSDKKFAMDILHNTHVLFVPGSGFDWPQPDHFRLVMLPEPDEITAALNRIGDFLSTYRQD